MPPEMNAATVTAEQLKQMADKQAAPLLEELKKPNDPETSDQSRERYISWRGSSEKRRNSTKNPPN